jgi:hypothetical protein
MNLLFQMSLCFPWVRLLQLYLMNLLFQWAPWLRLNHFSLLFQLVRSLRSVLVNENDGGDDGDDGDDDADYDCDERWMNVSYKLIPLPN